MAKWAEPTAWNFNMDQAPRGEEREVSRTVGKHRIVSVKLEHVPAPIIAAGACGVVTVSRWLPEEERWNMFTKASPPVAWMPWPTHPGAQ
jgi:hypothetical protein